MYVGLIFIERVDIFFYLLGLNFSIDLWEGQYLMPCSFYGSSFVNADMATICTYYAFVALQ